MIRKAKKRGPFLRHDFVAMLLNTAYRKQFLKEASLDELLALIRWFQVPPELKDQEEWRFRLARLARERASYIEANISENLWPALLQGEDWAEKIWADLSGGQALPDDLLSKYNFSKWFKTRGAKESKKE